MNRQKHHLSPDSYPSLRRAFLLVVTFFVVIAGFATASDPEIKPVRESIYVGYSIIADENGDSMIRYHLRPVTIYPPLKFKSKKEEKFYWRTVSQVRKTLPYAKMIRETLIETYEYIETFPTVKEREDYLKKMEKELFEQYKPVLKRLSKSQAKMLVKLIQRETDQSSYEIVKAFLGSARAIFWQGFGKLFGVSLKGKFEPRKNKDDAIIDRVATLIEQGTL